MSEGCCIGYKEKRTFRKNWNCQVWWHSTVISFRSAGSAWATLRDPCLQQQRAEGVDQQWSTHLDLWGSGFDSQHQKGERVRAHSWSRNSISRWNGEWRDEGDREGDDGANHQGRIKKRKSSFKEKYDRLWKSQVKPEGVWKTGPTDNSSLEGKAATAEMILEPVTVDYAGRAWRTSIEAVIFGRLASTSPAKGGLVCSICRCLWHKHPHQFQATSLSSLNVELWRNVPSWFLGASVSWLQLTTKCKKASNTILPLVFKEKTEPKKRKRTPS